MGARRRDNAAVPAPSDQDRWTAVDRYLADRLLEPDDALDQALEASTAAGLPPAGVTPTQGRLLELLARIQGARTILELGTLGAYSAIWLARALPEGGRLVRIDGNERGVLGACDQTRRKYAPRCASASSVGVSECPDGRP